MQPDLWSAHAELGSNLLRLGDIDEALAGISPAAYSGDPYSPTTVNTLRLLDRIDEFELTTTPVVSRRGETYVKCACGCIARKPTVLRPYAMELARRRHRRRSRSATASSCSEPVTRRALSGSR